LVCDQWKSPVANFEVSTGPICNIPTWTDESECTPPCYLADLSRNALFVNIGIRNLDVDSKFRMPMARNRQDVIQEFLTDYPEYREAGSRTLARLVMEEYPGVTGTLEQWRSAVRAYFGLCGGKNLSHAREPREPRVAGEHKRGCPPSLAQPREPFVLPPGKTLLLPDLHVPYHEVGAVELAVEYGIEHGATQVLLVGDFIDCHRLSQFVPDAEAVSFAEELRIAHDVLDYLQDRFQGAKFYYKIGNHEERLERYMYQKAPDVAVVDVWRMDKLLHLDERGIEYIANKLG